MVKFKPVYYTLVCVCSVTLLLEFNLHNLSTSVLQCFVHRQDSCHYLVEQLSQRLHATFWKDW